MFDLTGKIALVTGASGGIGAEIARAIHSQGGTVVLHGCSLLDERRFWRQAATSFLRRLRNVLGRLLLRGCGCSLHGRLLLFHDLEPFLELLLHGRVGQVE